MDPLKIHSIFFASYSGQGRQLIQLGGYFPLNFHTVVFASCFDPYQRHFYLPEKLIFEQVILPPMRRVVT